MLARAWDGLTGTPATFLGGSRPTDYGQSFADRCPQSTKVQPQSTKVHSRRFDRLKADVSNETLVLDLFPGRTVASKVAEFVLFSLNKPSAGHSFVKVANRCYPLFLYEEFDEIELDQDLSWLEALSGDIERDANQEKIDYLHKNLNLLMSEGKFNKVARCIEQIIKGSYSYELIVGAIRFTRKIRDQVQKWDIHAALAARRLVALGKDPVQLLGAF